MSLRIEDFSLVIREGKKVTQAASNEKLEKILFTAFNLEIKRGHIGVLMGPSGCGKSSLLNYILGVLPARPFNATGAVLLHQQLLNSLPAEKRGIGILFQDPLLFPHMSIAENLAFSLSRHVKGSKARLASIEAALDEAQLALAMKNRLPHTLSGGEQARVSVLRTLLSLPRAILLDEPFSKLDSNLRTAFRDFVYKSILERNIPALIVTHDKNDAAAIPAAAQGPLIELSQLVCSCCGGNMPNGSCCNCV